MFSAPRLLPRVWRAGKGRKGTAAKQRGSAGGAMPWVCAPRASPATVLGFLPHMWTVSQASWCLSTSPHETTSPLILVTCTWCITLWRAGRRVNRLIHLGAALSLPQEHTRLLFTALVSFSVYPGMLWEKCWPSTGWTPASPRNSCCKWHLWFALTALFEEITSKGLPVTPGWCVCLFSSHTVTFCLWFLSGSCFAVSYHQPSLAFDLFPGPRQSLKGHCAVCGSQHFFFHHPAACLICSLSTLCPEWESVLKFLFLL